MLNKCLCFLLLPLVLFSFDDMDMDGVDDINDKCLYTPFSDLVGSDGCTIESLESLHHFDIITGVSFSDTDYNTLSKTDTTTASLQLDYYYKNFSLSLNSSYFSNSSDTYSASGMNDTYLGVDYKLAFNKLYVSLGTGLLLPTYDTTLNNNNTDYTANVNLSYNIGRISLFGTYGYTFVNDDDVKDIVSYQNSNYFSLGLGYYLTSKFYLSSYYNVSDSIFKDVSKIQTVSLYTYYSINDNFFTTLNYAYGLSDTASDNYLSLKIGYYY